MYLTWLDSNSWLIEIAGQRILLDPWLVGPLVFGNMQWLLKGTRQNDRPIPDNIDLILLSQGLEDHAHPPTLAKLDRNIPVVGSPNAAKVVKKLDYHHITTLAHGESFTLNNKLEIKAFPGSPIGPNLIENGYLFKDLTSGYTIYYEPHGFHSPSLKDIAPVDVVITPIIDISIPLIGPVIKGSKSAVEVAKWLKPQTILATAAGGDIVFEGLLNSLLRATGGGENMRNLLAENNLATSVLEPQPGERFELQLQPRIA